MYHPCVTLLVRSSHGTSAIHREKQIMRWTRPFKYDLVNAIDATWRDLAEDFGFPPLAKGQADPGSSPG